MAGSSKKKAASSDCSKPSITLDSFFKPLKATTSTSIKSKSQKNGVNTKPQVLSTPQETSNASKQVKTPSTVGSMTDKEDTCDEQSNTNAAAQASKSSSTATTKSIISPSTRIGKKRREILEDSDEDSDEDEDVSVVHSDKACKDAKTQNASGKNITNDKAKMDEAKDEKEEKSTENTATKTTATKMATGKTTSSSNKKQKTSNGLSCGWGFLNGNVNQVMKEQAQKKRKSTATTTSKSSQFDGDDAGANVGRNIIKDVYDAGDDLPILSDPAAMFDDMVHNQLCQNGTNLQILKPLLKTLHGRSLKVATMCSGTESPVLALDMIKDAIEDLIQTHNITIELEDGSQVTPTLQLEHVFSCEIEPFKQAYIQRNFQPSRLFRDIRELGQDQAHTAYGGKADVPNTPGCVDLLVAGTSCVDFSNLNNSKKTLDQKGESGATFAGMLEWIVKAQPPLVILENVSGAPWDQMMNKMATVGYASTFERVDTKKYYIPHTRQRGYLFAVRKSGRSSVDDGRTKRWPETLKKLQRPASAALDAFMLNNDDPRVLRGMARLTNESSVGDSGESRAGRTDWTRCETRHQYARSEEALGDKRPFTGWSDSGKTTMPGYAWNEWGNSQVHRVHDLLDINSLRLAKFYCDPTYKTMIWNLSQNVDRDTMGKLGLSQCLTPTGIMYVTHRGGPLIGDELLLLQGIPADDLIFTHETEDNLKDLAGNAMSTTVVGACILAGLVNGHKALLEQDLPSKKSESMETNNSVVSSLVPRPLLQMSEVEITQAFGEYQSKRLNLGQPSGVDVTKLLEEGFLSSRKCTREGTDEALSPIYECTECGQTAGQEAATINAKYEEHSFELMNDLMRIHPPDFRRKLLDSLPMVLEIPALDVDCLDKPVCANEKLWKEWKERVSVCANAEYRFAFLERNHIWTAVYRTTSGETRLELRLYKNYAEWLLFAEAPCKRGPLRDILERPVARFNVSSNSFVGGRCHICLPIDQKVTFTVEAHGDPQPSWRNRLGLKGKFETEVQFEKLKIELESDDEELKKKIDGLYKYLPKCGGACGSMHQKIVSPNSKGEELVYFFLESGRKTTPDEDSFVFCGSCHRTSYGEFREVYLTVDPKVQYRPVFENDKPSEEKRKQVLPAIIPGKWITLDNVAVREIKKSSQKLVCSVPSSNLAVPVHLNGWRRSPALASFTFPANSTDHVFLKCERASAPLDLNLQKSTQILRDLAFVTSRLTIPDCEKKWSSLDRSSLEKGNGDDAICSTCSPPKASVRWTLVSKGNKSSYVPMEDWQEAAQYEARLKVRPSPWNVRFTSEADQLLNVQIGCNAVSLCQRAYGMFPPNTPARRAMIQQGNSEISYDWRVVPHTEKSSEQFPKLKLSSNKNDEEAPHPPNFRLELRKEQRRSLSWMLRQENANIPFLEEEVCESLLPSLQWQAEGRVRRPVQVFGGIVCDEVGYGKTCISLALIDSNAESANYPQQTDSPFICTRATLVVVPGHLMLQWPREIEKFLGKSKKVCVITDMKSFNDTAIEDITAADIVVVNFTVLCNDMYYRRLARFAGRSSKSLPTGKKGGRQFDFVYESCLENIPNRVSQLKDDASMVYEAIESDAKKVCKEEAKDDDAFKTERKKSQYKINGVSSDNTSKKAKGEKENKKVKEETDTDPWKARTEAVKKDYTKMKCPPLELFHWKRIIVDEFTYLLDKSDRRRPLSVVRRLSARNRWYLSGTPRHENFDDVQNLASLLGLYLGAEEPLHNSKIAKASGSKAAETTGAEQMSLFMEKKSVRWHERRLGKAQEFLDRFVRQNIAEIDEIPGEEIETLIDLPPVERAIYLELSTYLQSLEMNAQTAKMSKKKSQSDRESRMQKILQDSHSAEEALLKCCTHFDLSGESGTPLKTCEDIIKFRKEQKAELERDIITSVAAAIRQQQRIERMQPGWLKITKAEKGELLDSVGRYLKDVKAEDSVAHGADIDVHQLLKELVKKAKRESEEEPDKHHSAFNDEMDNEDATEEDSCAAKKRKISSPKKEDEVDQEQLFAMKKALRDFMHQVRSLGKELCGRVRSLRYIETIRGFQSQGEGAAIHCKGCKRKNVDLADAGIMACCGHTGCLQCLEKHAAHGSCVESPFCAVQAKLPHVIPAMNLGADGEGEGDGRDGAKLTEIIKKVEDIMATSDDMMIIFVQFDDLKQKVAEALRRHNIKAVEVKGTVDKQVSALEPFQNEKPRKGDPRVLLLKMDDEQSAGLNLTRINHCIFAHPLLADNKQQYEAYETQAIGRVRRYGQLKTVYVSRFLVCDSIDTEIFQQFGGRSIF